MSNPIVEITDQELPHNLKTLWLKALSAVEIKNFSYAISLVNAVLKEAPGFLEGRRVARKCAAMVAAESGKRKGGGMTALLSGGMSTMKLGSAAKKDPLAALIQIEKELEKDPYDPQVNEVLHETALSIGFKETAAFALETVREGAPENSKVLHRLAEFYLAEGQPSKASDVYNDIVKHNPADIDAVKGAKDSSAKASMQEQKWDSASGIQDLKKDAAKAAELENADRAALTKDQQVQKLSGLIDQYNQDQNNLNVVKQIAALYEEMENWTDAHAFYDWAYQLSNADSALKKKASDLGDRVAREQVKAMEAQLAADPGNAELQAQVAEIKKDRAREGVTVAQQRVEQNPTDPQLRFELGTALYDAGEYSDAIPHLQQATRNPHIRTKVLLTLARAFDGKNMFDLAVKQLSDALADLQAMDDTKKEVLYEKGLIHAKMEDAVRALECFKEIYEVDYGYRDVAQRVESSYS
ncbi:tetratricopeptide repeat protein [Rubritalea marina]|uniref:tetratricopeptide repeat protein n=1 Tax=Rubritalea marina TaxID=361055 RepID=UPI00037BDCFD|nr:tetratricopeptide repeat protein [Rubritalea marina]